MYSPEIISALTNRIRWNEALDSDFPIELSGINKTGTSGKHFQSFHQLVAIDNVYAAVPKADMDAGEFNTVLEDIRKQATLAAVSEIMDENDAYLPDLDYSELMKSNIAIFDKAIGYKVAVSVLELLLSSKRINPEERSAKLAAGNLKLELEGFRNENGHIVAKGIRYYYEKAVRSATNKLFPKKIIVKSDQIW